MGRLYSLVLSFLYAVVIACSLIAAISATGMAVAQTGTVTQKYDLPLTCSPPPTCGGTGIKCTPVSSGPYTFNNCKPSRDRSVCGCYP
jgi:hypothetical protein